MTTLPFEQTPVNLYASGLDGDGAFLDFIAVIDDCQTIRFKHGWYQPGDFELTINKNTNYAPLFQRKRIIQIGSDVTKCGVIEYVENQVGPTGALSEIIVVRGRELTSYLDRRQVNPPTGQAYYTLPVTTPAETVVKNLVDASLGPSADANRKDANLTIETDAATGAAYVLSARYDNLLTLVGNCCLATDSGIFAYLNHTTKKWVFGFGLGTDRTTGQTTNPQAVFSTDRETTEKSTMKDVDTGFKNFALVGGQGEGAARTIVSVPTVEPTGIDRREMFVDARDLSLTASLQERGLQKLAENQFVKFISSDVLAYSQLIYGQDYNVGDEVTIEQFGQTQDAFITSAEESWKNGSYNLVVGFDRSSPTLPSQVAQALTRIQKTLNSTEVQTQEGTAFAFSPFEVAAGAQISVPADHRLIVEPVEESIQASHIPLMPITDPVSGNVTYLFSNYPAVKTILIPSAMLVASSGGPYNLTLTTGSGSTVIVPISASGDTITSGDLLFDIYVDSSGNITSKAWEIEGSNSNGGYVKFSGGAMGQSGTTAVTTNTAYAGSFFYSSTDAIVTFPTPFIGALPTIMPSAQMVGSVGGTYLSNRAANPLTLSGCGVNVLTSNNATAYTVYWQGDGRWR